MNLTIPELSLVVLIGTSGAGKSTFARRHFASTEVLSSDACRAMVSDDENDLGATKDAFEVLHFIAGKRLAGARLTAVDATNVQPEARKPLVELARRYHVLPVAIVLNLPERICQERNRHRPDRDFGPHVIRRQHDQLRRSLRGLQREGFRHVFVLSSEEEIASVTITRQKLWNNRKDEHGPFDLIGDVHGCFDELWALLVQLGYQVSAGPDGFSARHPEGRKAVFLGDLVDRGPNSPDVLRMVMAMVASGDALCVPGNHDMKLLRKLRGRDVQVSHGLAETLAQLEQEPAAFKEQLVTFLDDLVSHYVLDDGKLVVAHAGMKEEMQGRGSGRVRDFALYGETTGETDEFGLPVRLNWAADYRGKAMVVYGHTPVPQPDWLNNTINVDTGCVFGGRLTALRYPEKELVSVPAARTYYEPARPLHPAAPQTADGGRMTDVGGGVDRPPSSVHRPALSAQHAHDDVLDLEDVLGKRIVETRLHGKVTVREENATAALEVMTRFAADPKWLVYLPPTMSPSETSAAPGLLEHPSEAFAHYRAAGVAEVVCEEKHMGSRAVVIVCRSEEAARARFGVTTGESGICYTRTGRRFFNDVSLETAFLERVRAAVDAAGLWDEFKTDWLCLDCELMPWSAKAQELLRGQYAATGAAARAALPESVATLRAAAARLAGAADTSGTDGAPGDAASTLDTLLDRFEKRAELAGRFVESYRRYCWPVHSLADLRLAPFHILATEGAVHTDKDHLWHMETLSRLVQEDGQLFMSTPHKLVDLSNEASQAAAIAWWESLTSAGGEGMVVKPRQFVALGARGRLAQPAVKCRGPEYLRIIYGPEYTLPEHLQRLRQRGLGGKRSAALREFSLGVEALERFVRREPLRRVHECVFAVLALESEPLDPRL